MKPTIETEVSAKLRELRYFKYNARDYVWSCIVGLPDPDEEMELMNDYSVDYYEEQTYWPKRRFKFNST